MSVPTSYLTTTKNTAAIFEAIQKAGVPEAFTYEFLKALGFASSSDRPLIPVMKAIGFLDAGGRPTSLYREYKDRSIAGAALAQGLRAGYADLFAIDADAQKRSVQDLTGMFGRLTDKGEAVTQKMAYTFRALSEMANFDAVTDSGVTHDESHEDAADQGVDRNEQEGGRRTGGSFNLRHDIHVHLPLTTDVAVYDAIFKSLRANLL